MTTTHHLDMLEATHPIAQLADALTPMWQNGWHPLDVARSLDIDKLSLKLYVDALSLCRASWHHSAAALWGSQADDLGATAPWWHLDQSYWPQFLARHNAQVYEAETAANLFALRVRRPHEMPILEGPPWEPGWGTDAHATDDAVLAKVRGLLAKAESTTFEHEAESLSAKAQELIARHSIDVALLGAEVDVPGGRRLYLHSPYTKPKFFLLAEIASVNRCRTCWNSHTATATLMGHHSDMHLTEVLFTSLLLQGTSAVLSSGPQRTQWGQPGTKAWRNAFWYGYAQRIGQRLRAAATTVREQHEETTGNDLVPVLAARSDAVDRVFDEAFPETGSISVSVSSTSGIEAGHDFANRAELSGDRTVPHTRPRELSS